MQTTKTRLPSVISLRDAIIKEINRLNANAPSKPCASQKFGDASALMNNVFTSLGVDVIRSVADAGYDEETEIQKALLWTQAWDQARALGFALRRHKDLAYQIIKNPPKTIDVMELVKSIAAPDAATPPHLLHVKQDMHAAVETVEYDSEELTLFSLRHPQLVHQDYFDHWARSYVRKSCRTALGAHQIDSMARQLKDRCGSIELGPSVYFFESELPELGASKIVNNIRANRQKIDKLHKEAVNCLKRRSARKTVEFELMAGLPPREFHTQWAAKNYARLAASLGHASANKFTIKKTRTPSSAAQG